MVINCDVNKTEYICFNRVKDDNTPIPSELQFGHKEIKLVTETKVLGLLIDDKLSLL